MEKKTYVASAIIIGMFCIIASCSSIKQKVHALTEPDAVESQQTADQPKKAKTQKAEEESKNESAAVDSKNNGGKKEGGLWSAIMDGTGSATDIGPNSYSIEVSADIITGSAGKMYKKWDETAKKACNGPYKVMERQLIHDSSGVGKSDRLIGAIECK